MKVRRRKSPYAIQICPRSMAVGVHNPRHCMAILWQFVAQGRKRIGILVGAGALKATCCKNFDAECAEPESPRIETILPRMRNLADVIGKTKAAMTTTGKGMDDSR